MSSEHEKMHSSSENEGKNEARSNEGRGEIHNGELRRRHEMSFSSEERMRNAEGNDSLTQHFSYPPPGQQSISPRPLAMSEETELSNAMQFLNNIKEEYADSLWIFDNFLETMRDFKFGKIDADEVCKGVRLLFKDKPQLVRQFEEYLPDHLRFAGGRSFNNSSFNNSSLSNDRMDKFQQFGRMPPSFSSGLPMGRMVQNVPMPSTRHAFQSGFSNNRTSSPQPLLKEPAILDTKSPKHHLAKEFIKLVKKTYFSKPFIYEQFIDLLKNCESGFDKLLSQVSALLLDSPELVEKFEKNFRPEGTNVDSTVDLDPLRNIKDTLAEKGILEDFLRAMNYYNQNCISADDLIFLLEPIINDEVMMKALKTFMKYEDPQISSLKLPDCETIGSYKIFPSPIEIHSTSAIAREVLNNMCKSVSTLESEDGVYIFRDKNSSEELLVRIDDDRCEADLNMGRLKYLITKLEELYSEIDNFTNLEMEDIEMSSALVKETLKKVYDSKSSQVLETILESPQKAIPVILVRLHKVYRDNLSIFRQKRKFWRNLVNENYYKAYDTLGVQFKSDERRALSPKNIFENADQPFSVRVDDLEVADLICSFFRDFVSNISFSGSRRYAAELQTEYFNGTLSSLMAPGAMTTVEFDRYALMIFILTIYDRFLSVKHLPKCQIPKNTMAVEIGLQEESEVVDDEVSVNNNNLNINGGDLNSSTDNLFANIVSLTTDLVTKEIDSDQYENEIRFITGSRGYKLYNLKRILSKAEKQIVLLLDQASSESAVENTFPGNYAVSNSDGIVTLCRIKANDEYLKE